VFFHYCVLMRDAEREKMTKSELKEIILKARNMNLDDGLDPDEEWDSLDHLSIIAQLSGIEGAIPQDVDLSSLTTFNLLAKALCD